LGALDGRIPGGVRSGSAGPVTYAALPALAAGAYYLLALVAAFLHLFTRDAAATTLPPVSILKPIHGHDPEFYKAIRSHAIQDYPEFEILFGVRDPDDGATADIERLAAEFPERPIRLVHVAREANNGKVGVLAELAKLARGPLLLVNDSDIFVEPDYLRHVVAPLEDSRVGVVTCLYRARAGSGPSRWEAIGLETEFVPSVLVARLIGESAFALGSTMVFRADQIRQIGGFEAVEDYIADDYQLGARVAALGYKVALATTVVETDLGGEDWGEVWRHQLRWSRTIRVSRPAGYFGYVVTHATLWALVAVAAGAWRTALAVLAVRMAAGVTVSAAVLGERRILSDFWLIPMRDLWGFAVWAGGLFGDTVQWRDKTLRLSRDGKIRPVK
jgi:ceramide glucosyltransferase